MMIMPETKSPLLQISQLTIRQKEIILFQNFNLVIGENGDKRDSPDVNGDRLGIYAPTGTGKTTLLNWIAGIMPEGDAIQIEGRLEKSETLTTSYVFQEPRLIPSVTVLKNVMLPLERDGGNTKGGKKEAAEKACAMLEKLFLGDKLDSMPEKLSGGEKQRASIARAFTYPGKLLLMDEPFHSQDDEKRGLLIEITKELVEKENRALIIISHNKDDLERLGCHIITEKDFICRD